MRPPRMSPRRSDAPPTSRSSAASHVRTVSDHRRPMPRTRSGVHSSKVRRHVSSVSSSASRISAGAGGDTTAGNATSERDGPCARQSWTAWTVSEATLRQVPNQAEGVVELRCGITCPHCNAVFFVPASSMPKNKGFYCKAHLRSSSCVPVPQSEASQQDGPVPTEEAAGTSTVVEVAQKPPSKRSRTNASLHRHCQEQLATVNARLNSLETEALMRRRT